MTANKNGWTRTALIAFTAFAGLGLSSGLLGVAWPSIRDQFALHPDSVSILFIVNTVTYSLASFSIGRLMSRFGSGMTLLAGAALMALCLLGIATTSLWVLVVLFSMLEGFGAGLIDAGLNLYIATYHTAQQMNFLHACFGIGITLGPLVMTFALGHALGWQTGYATVGLILVVVAVIFFRTRKWWQTEGFQTAENKPVVRATFAQTLRLPTVWFSLVTYLAYVGMEIGIGQWAYTILTESRQIAPEVAGPWVSVYWGAFTGGRIFWSIIANRFPIEKVLRFSMLGAALGAFLFWWNPVEWVGFAGLVIVGAAQAPIFPMMMAGTAQRVGNEHAENTISMQMGAVGIGAAILPGLIGSIGTTFGLEKMALAFVVMGIIIVVLHELIYVWRRQPVVVSTVGD
ncbi:MAG TPA: MFS transporter [Aggregatilineales bacterium]|nr:MFS transporter [Aggregatilineales bacterium]